MIAPYIQFELAKRDAIRVFKQRLADTLAKLARELGGHDDEYRKGWNDCLRHVQRYLLE